MIPGWIARIVDKKGPLGQKRDLKLANKNHFWAGMESRKIQLQFNRSPETAPHQPSSKVYPLSTRNGQGVLLYWTQEAGYWFYQRPLPLGNGAQSSRLTD